MSLKNPEFTAKRIVRRFLEWIEISPPQVSDPFLKRLQELGDVIVNCEKKNDPKIRKILSNVANFALALGENDEAWRMRLIFAIWLIKKTRFKFTPEEIAWCKAHLQRGVWNELEKRNI